MLVNRLGQGRREWIQPQLVGGGPERRSLKLVNTVPGNLKTAISGTYHAFSFQKYAHRYLGGASVSVQSSF